MLPSGINPPLLKPRRTGSNTLDTLHEESHSAISLQIDFMDVRNYLTFHDNYAFHQGAGSASITHSPT
jgi:hypothetical protein